MVVHLARLILVKEREECAQLRPTGANKGSKSAKSARS